MSRDGGSLSLLRQLDLSDRLLLAAIVLLPWAFGGIEIWAYRAAQLLIVAAVIARYSDVGEFGRSVMRRRGIAVPVVLLGLLAVLQLLPLPLSLIETLSPQTGAIYRQVGLDDGTIGVAELDRLPQLVEQ